MTVSGVTATLTALTGGELNQTTSGFGINSTPSGDDTDQIDDGSGVVEAIQVSFNSDVFLTGLAFSSWGSDHVASLTIAGLALPNLSGSSSHTFVSNNFLTAGQTFVLGFVAGNGFSFDRFTITTSTSTSVPDSAATLLLLAPILGALALAHRRRVVDR